MSLTLNILLWSFIAPVIYTYFVYPMITIGLARKKRLKEIKGIRMVTRTSILMAAYNEELVIESKIQSILASKHPTDQIEILIGTDNCTDNTDKIIQEYAEKHEIIKHVRFNERSGKIKIINSLFEMSKGEVLILTDANVMFTEHTIDSLLNHFADSKVGLVDSNMKNYGMKSTGISIPEKTYISIEGKLKYAEGALWGTMMGPFGGCFAIRKSLFSKVPNTFLVDDFFLNMKVLENGHSCLNEPNAVVYEDVSNNLRAEFIRKSRISAGNFQNLAHFFHLLFKFNRLSFVFLSHKILRWLCPFFILTIGVILFLIYEESLLNMILFFSYIACIGLVAFDLILIKLGVHIKPFRYLTHFAAMNAALFIGFFKFIRGSKNSVWKRTERLQA